MNMLISLLSNFGGWIVAGIIAVASIWGIRLQGKSDGRAEVEAEQADADRKATETGAEVRRSVSALRGGDAQRRLRDRDWRK
jgi:hypothetical protein